MKRMIMMAALATVFACGSGFEAEHQKMVEEYEAQKAVVQRLQQEYDTRLQAYQQAREAHEALAGENEDSLHTAINEMHDGLLLNHEAFRAQYPEALKNLEGLKARHTVEHYPQDSIRADHLLMLNELKRIENEYRGMHDEFNQMMDEQQGMTARH